MYLLDSSAIIDPFRSGKLEAIHGALSGGSRANAHLDAPGQTAQYLEKWFEEGFTKGRLVISEEVYEEVVKQAKTGSPGREFLQRLRNDGKVKILEPTEATYSVLRGINGFVRRYYEDHHAEGFLKKHDPMLIALAKSHGAALVSEERNCIPEVDVTTGRVKGEPRLPFVAWAMEVKCVGLLQVLGEAL